MSYRDVVMADRPTHYWRCNGRSGVLVEPDIGLGTPANLTLVSPDYSPPVVVGDSQSGSLRFTNGVTRSAQTAAALNLSGPTITMEAWANPTVSMPYGNNSVACGQNNTGYLIFKTDTATNNWAFGLNAGGSYLYAVSGIPVVAGNRVYLVGTYDGANMRLYINGTLSATTAATGSVVANEIFSVGEDPFYGAPREFNGDVSEVAVYTSVVLPLDRILAHYNAGKDQGYGQGWSRPDRRRGRAA